MIQPATRVLQTFCLLNRFNFVRWLMTLKVKKDLTWHHNLLTGVCRRLISILCCKAMYVFIQYVVTFIICIYVKLHDKLNHDITINLKPLILFIFREFTLHFHEFVAWLLSCPFYVQKCYLSLYCSYSYEKYYMVCALMHNDRNLLKPVKSKKVRIYKSFFYHIKWDELWVIWIFLKNF